MKERVEVRSQAEFDVCVRLGKIAIVIDCRVEAWENSSVVAWGNSSVVAWGNSSVEAWENSSVVAWGNSSVVARGNSSVEAWGNSSVEAWENSSVEAWENSSVEAWENSSVEARGNSSVEAWGNSSVEARGNSSVVAWGNSSVEAWENSSVVAWGNSSVEARGNSSVEARGNSSVVAWGYAFIRWFSARKIKASLTVIIAKIGSPDGKLEGGRVLDCPLPQTAMEWCEHYGVEVKDGVAILYKGLNDKFISERGCDYSPGTIPVAADWDGGGRECGDGLHFSPHPKMTLEFARSATKFVACPVALADMRAPQDSDSYPNKIKARGCSGKTYEVARDGKPVSASKKKVA